MGRIIEGYWDCEYCGTKKIRGSIRDCPNCLKPRGENIRFYLDESNKTYVSESKSIHINRNPDWLCNYCSCLNSDSSDTCISCGAPRTSSNLNYFQNRKEKENETEFETSSLNQTSLNDFSRNSHHDDSTYSKLKTSNNSFSKVKKSSFSYDNLYNLFPFVLVFLVILLIGFILFPREQEITVTDFSWKYLVNIEKYETVEESSWSLPAGAVLIKTTLELSHYQDVLDHYETKTREVARERLVGYEEYVSGYRDLGNGYFEEITSSRPIYETYYETETYEEPVYRTEPVFETKYYYNIDKWIFSRTLESKGNDKNPYWPEVILLNNERISSKDETYMITGLDKNGKIQNVTLSFEDWEKLELDQTVKLKVSLGHGSIVNK